MKIKDFDVEKVQLLLQFFPQDLELKSIDFSDGDIKFSFEADYKQALADRRNKSAKDLYNLIAQYDKIKNEKQMLEAEQMNLLFDNLL